MEKQIKLEGVIIMPAVVKNFDFEKKRKEKRWEVYTSAFYAKTNLDGSTTLYRYNDVWGKDSDGAYHAVSDEIRSPWTLELETTSLKEAKRKVNDLIAIHGVSNVKMVRIVDFFTELGPVS